MAKQRGDFAESARGDVSLFREHPRQQCNGGRVATVRLRQSAFKISSGDGLDCVVERQLDDRSGLRMRLSDTEEEEKSQEGEALQPHDRKNTGYWSDRAGSGMMAGGHKSVMEDSVHVLRVLASCQERRCRYAFRGGHPRLAFRGTE